MGAARDPDAPALSRPVPGRAGGSARAICSTGGLRPPHAGARPAAGRRIARRASAGASARGRGRRCPTPGAGAAAAAAGPPCRQRPAPRVRVVVADDHPLARAGVRRLLAADPDIRGGGRGGRRRRGAGRGGRPAARRACCSICNWVRWTAWPCWSACARTKRGRRRPATVVLTTY